MTVPVSLSPRNQAIDFTSGPSQRSSPVTAAAVAQASAVAAVSILAQFYSLWRALQLGDDRRAAYAVTVRCFGGGLLMLIVSWP